MNRNNAVNYPEQYRTDLLSAVSAVDLAPVRRVIDVLVEARALNQRIFVCASGASASLGGQLLCELVMGGAYNRSERFRILALPDSCLVARTEPDDFAKENFFVEQLKNVLEYGDVVMGISSTGNPAKILRALEYATRIGCLKIAITGSEGHKVASLADIHIPLPSAHPASVEDSLIIVCRMIGNAILHAGSC
jgi:D-sedoheptulose 7-phosphate isomerase